MHCKYINHYFNNVIQTMKTVQLHAASPTTKHSFFRLTLFFKRQNLGKNLEPNHVLLENRQSQN